MIRPRAFSSLPENTIGKFNILVRSLINKLQDEINIYSELYKLINNEREIIRQPSIEALSTNNSQKEACFLRAQLCKDDRDKISKAIAKILTTGCADEINISVISDYADRNLRQQLLDHHDRLYSLVNVIRKSNDRNKYLLQSSISHTRSTLMFIHKSETVPIRYMSSGQLPVAIPNGKILYKKG